jgi:large subunit ribosomal protein L21
MYSVVEIKGHQYKLKAGDLIDVERIEAEVGATLNFDKVLLIGGTTTVVGAPTVGGAKVTAKVVKQGRTRKILVLKRKPGAYRKKNGHRQCFTGLLITEINDGKGGVSKAEAKTKTAKPAKAAKAEKPAKATKTAKTAKTAKAKK